MFIYEKNGAVCVTFKSNMPVAAPEYEIYFNKETGSMYVNGKPVLAVEEKVLADNVELATAEVVDSAVAIDLNGKVVSMPEDTAGDGVYRVTNGGMLTINGDGVINAVGQNEYSMAIWADGGDVRINGGTFTNVGADAYPKANGKPTDHFDLIYVKNGGRVEINGGYFECQTPKWTLNSHDTKPGVIVVKGGTFKGYNPAESYTEPTGGKPFSFVADGYKVVQEGDLFKVIKA